MMNNDQPIEILLVEDRPGDVSLILEVMKDARVRNHMSMVKDGVEALAFLRREGDYADAPRPDLILLDLNLPKKDGKKVLAEIKTDPILRRIPVIVLTASKDEEDILKSYDLYANCFITKSINMEQFITVVKSIEDFWLISMKLPHGVER